MLPGKCPMQLCFTVTCIPWLITSLSPVCSSRIKRASNISLLGPGVTGVLTILLCRKGMQRTAQSMDWAGQFSFILFPSEPLLSLFVCSLLYQYPHPLSGLMFAYHPQPAIAGLPWIQKPPSPRTTSSNYISLSSQKIINK